jgi:hypothetical protein
MSKLIGFVHPAMEILNFGSFGPLKSCGGSMHVSRAYILKKNTVRGQYRSQHGKHTLSL